MLRHPKPYVDFETNRATFLQFYCPRIYNQRIDLRTTLTLIISLIVFAFFSIILKAYTTSKTRTFANFRTNHTILSIWKITNNTFQDCFLILMHGLPCYPFFLWHMFGPMFDTFRERIWQFLSGFLKIIWLMRDFDLGSSVVIVHPRIKFSKFAANELCSKRKM